MNWFDGLFIILAYTVVIGALVFTCDDLFIDLYAIIKRISPTIVTSDFIAQIKRVPSQKIAILVANWKEADVIEPMIRGNLRGIEYSDYTFFLGVYPNDIPTWAAARKLEQLFPQKVVVIVNSLHGPTSKGQMLNEMVKQIINFDHNSENKFDLFLMQDSEDVLHRHSLSLMNYFSTFAHFVQIPVFSFNVELKSLVAGVYIDEFAESHTKDLLVREALGAAIPSAGVGTLISRKLILALQQYQQGHFLKEDTLTEDYHLGMMTKELGFKSKFACVEYQKENGVKEFIATREYFPSEFRASIRQKSRWVLGVALQGHENLSWKGSLIDKYFMWRDRRGPWNSVFIILSTFLLFIFMVNRSRGTLPSFLQQTFFQSLVALNMFNMFFRVTQRMRAVARTNATAHVYLVPIRWLLANIINTAASSKAFFQFKESQRTGKRPVWIKTTHRLPEKFGQDEVVISQ